MVYRDSDGRPDAGVARDAAAAIGDTRLRMRLSSSSWSELAQDGSRGPGQLAPVQSAPVQSAARATPSPANTMTAVAANLTLTRDDAGDVLVRERGLHVGLAAEAVDRVTRQVAAHDLDGDASPEGRVVSLVDRRLMGAHLVIVFAYSSLPVAS